MLDQGDSSEGDKKWLQFGYILKKDSKIFSQIGYEAYKKEFTASCIIARIFADPLLGPSLWENYPVIPLTSGLDMSLSLVNKSGMENKVPLSSRIFKCHYVGHLLFFARRKSVSLMGLIF